MSDYEAMAEEVGLINARTACVDFESWLREQGEMIDDVQKQEWLMIIGCVYTGVNEMARDGQSELSLPDLKKSLQAEMLAERLPKGWLDLVDNFFEGQPLTPHEEEAWVSGPHHFREVYAAQFELTRVRGLLAQR